jgi:hypothetical protein
MAPELLDEAGSAYTAILLRQAAGKALFERADLALDVPESISNPRFLPVQRGRAAVLEHIPAQIHLQRWSPTKSSATITS